MEKTHTATCMVLARAAAKVLRHRPVTSLDEVAEIHAELPRNDLGVTLDGVEWFYFPEFDSPVQSR